MTFALSIPQHKGSSFLKAYVLFILENKNKKNKNKKKRGGEVKFINYAPLYLLS